MNETDKQNAYRTMLVIWAALLGSQLLFFAMVYVVVDGLFPLDLSRPFFGNNAWAVGLAIFFGVDALVFSFVRRGMLLKKSVAEQSVDVVQQALIVSLALSEAVTLEGLFLAFAYRYPYFFIWMIVGFITTLIHFPQRRDIDNATFKSAQ